MATQNFKSLAAALVAAGILSSCGGGNGHGWTEGYGNAAGAGGGPSGSGGDASTCSIQVSSGSHTECDWALCGGFSDPDVCCSEVTDYKNVRGTICNGTCVDLASDSTHCANCDTRCAAGAHCSEGVCVLPGTAGMGGGSSAGRTSNSAAGSAAGSAGANAAAGGPGTGGAYAAGGSGSTSPNPCLGVLGWSLFCGANLTNANPSQLYLCDDGTTFGSVVCPSGCHAAAVGEPDYCLGDDPCVSGVTGGEICGRNLSPNAEPRTLYTCENQQTVGTMFCDVDCIPQPPGTADVCLIEQ